MCLSIPRERFFLAISRIEPPNSDAHFRLPRRILDCGGKRSATPLSRARSEVSTPKSPARSKAPSPLRSAGAVQNLSATRWFTEKRSQHIRDGTASCFSASIARALRPTAVAPEARPHLFEKRPEGDEGDDDEFLRCQYGNPQALEQSQFRGACEHAAGD